MDDSNQRPTTISLSYTDGPQTVVFADETSKANDDNADKAIEWDGNDTENNAENVQSTESEQVSGHSKSKKKSMEEKSRKDKSKKRRKSVSGGVVETPKKRKVDKQ